MRAKELLEHPGIAIQAANWAGAPVEYILRRPLPKWARVTIDSATHHAVDACCRLALKTVGPSVVVAKPRNGWHKVGVGVTGAVGGFFGIVGAPIELPITTTAMLRSILDIARSHGEPMDAAETRLACMEVLAFGGSSNTDDAADTGYFAVRTALAQQVSAAVDHLAAKGMTERGAPAMVTLINRIAAYFAIPVSEKLIAETIPIIGALSGSALNLIFISHFQRMAEGHFAVRELERKYGRNVVRAAYSAA